MWVIILCLVGVVLSHAIRDYKGNIPFDYVHDINVSYGWILFPWFGCWIGLRKPYKSKHAIYTSNGYQICKFKAFHNCTVTHVG